MSYFDPRIYNYTNLHDDDKDRLFYYDAAVSDALDALDTVIDDIALDHDTVSLLQADILRRAKKEMIRLLECRYIEAIVGIMDGGESYDDIKALDEYDVPDWFYDEEDATDDN